MNSRIRFQIFLGLVCALFAAPSRGQQPTETTPDSTSSDQQAVPSQATPGDRPMPAPALRGLFVGPGEPVQDNSTATPDTHALTGGEAIGFGDLQRPRDVLDFAAHVAETADTGIVPGNVTSVSQLGGAVNFDQRWGRFHSTVVYNGAALEYYPSNVYNQQSHTVGVSQDIEWERWVVRLRNDFVASPQATFSGLDTGGFGVGQIGLLATILPGLAPNETIQTGYTMRLNEVGLGEVDYRLSRRATLTFSGSYGILHFLSPGYIDSHEANGRVGYNYALDAKNTLGFLYEYTLLGYNGLGQKVSSNLGQVTFGRRVVGRLAFAVAAGPERLELDNYASAVQSQWAWSAYALVTYAQRRTNYSVTFSRGLVGGAGVLLGAYGDLLTGTVSYQLARAWTASAGGGYARNNNVTAATAQPNANLFSNYYGNANLTHNLNRHLVLALTYGVQKQNTVGVCPVANCGIVGLRQVGGFTLDWHTQKIALN